MSRGPKKFWFKSVLTVAVSIAPVFDTPAFAGACSDMTQKLVNACRSNQQSINSGISGGMDTSATKTGLGSNGSLFSGAGAAGVEAGNLCSSSAQKCKEACAKDGGQEAQKKCEQAVSSVATQMQTQAAANSSTGGDMSMMAGLIGAGLGMAMGMMMAKKNQEQPQPAPQPVATGALQLNGSLNCSMQDSYKYEDCNSFLTQYCGAQATAAASAAANGTTLTSTPMTGTVISSAPGVLPATPDCVSFNASFCSTSVTAPQPYGYQRMDGAVTQVNMAGTGEGLGTPYCANTAATAWCSDAMYGSQRAQCPACRQLQTTNSQTCATNPALCTMMDSPQQLSQVTTNAACQGDPLYTPGSPYALGGTTTTGTVNTGVPVGTTPVATINNGTGLPNVILPSASGGSESGTYTMPGTSQIATASAGGHSGAAANEGHGVNGARAQSASGSSSGSLSGNFGNITRSSAHASANELIAAGGVIIASGNGSGASRGPASDVEAQFGPSLFVTSSAVIRNHCASGRLNCP